MKVKITLLIIRQDIKLPFEHDKFFEFLVDDNLEFPSTYISTKDEVATLKELFENHLNICFEWCHFEISDFRKSDINECEIIYSIKLPSMLNIEKRGKFISHNNKLELDKFYEKILSRKRRIF